MSDGSFNMIDENGNDVEISTFEMQNCTVNEDTARIEFTTADGEIVNLADRVKITDNTFGFQLPPKEIDFYNSLSDVELIGDIIEGLDDEDQEEALAVWVNRAGWVNVDWSKVGDEFREAYAGSYESYADFAKDDIDDNVPAAFHNFIDAEAYGKWSSEHYIVEEGASGSLHFFENN
jgi:hypothetical protein